MAVTDPRKAVAMDVAAYKANKDLAGGFMISGPVYNFQTGKIKIIVPPSQLRSDDWRIGPQP
jgi:carbonic anhydrase